VAQSIGLRTQIDLDIAQKFLIRQRRESYGKASIRAREILDFVFAPMGSNASPKIGQRQTRYDLRENEFALIHSSLQGIFVKGTNSAPRRSNRDQIKTSIYVNESLIYEPLI
jgi:hypothetical protein